MSLSDATYLPPLEFVEVVRVPQIALASVSALPININEDVGVGSSAEHVTGEDAHFVGVDCQDRRGDECLTTLLTRLTHARTHARAVGKLGQIKPCKSTGAAPSAKHVRKHRTKWQI